MFIFHWMRNVITMGLDVRETRVEQIKSKSWFKPDTSIKCKCVCVCVQFGNSGNAELMGACNECERFLIMTEMWQILSSFVKYSFTHKLSVVHVLVRSVFFFFFWYSFRCGSSSSCWCALLSFAVFFRLVLGYLVLIQFRKAQTKINTRSQFRVDSVQKVL